MAFTEFVGVDWGTSSFRAWHCFKDQEQRVLAKSKLGMSKLNQKDFAPYLEDILRQGRVPESVPVLICGMAGARGGWHEVPYVSAPAGIVAIAKCVAAVRAGAYNCHILPGVSLSTEGRFDVMRGEETLLFGALSQGAGDGLFCLPGTHSKWCWIEGGKLKNWHTIMTGELFALLSNKSTLSEFCDGVSTNIHNKPEFHDAVRDVVDGKRFASHDLFAIRARALLDARANTFDFTARLSGLLIGQEIAGPDFRGVTDVTLVSTGAICDVYRQAFGIAGIEARWLDSESAVLAGLNQFANELYTNTDIVEKAS